MSTTAKLFIGPAPDLGPEARKYVVDCKWATSTLYFAPGPIDLPEAHRVSICLQTHEDRCGKCQLGRLWREHGDPALKRATDELYDQVQQRMVERHLAGRVN